MLNIETELTHDMGHPLGKKKNKIKIVADGH